MDEVDDLLAVALLAEPARRKLYSYVRERGEPTGREEAARHAGISVKLAAFHLDRLADAGLLDVGFRRLSGRTGPGAGRPAKVYTASPRPVAVVIPQTRYMLAASMMATALSGAATSLPDVAHGVGNRLGAAIRAGTQRGRREAVREQLAQLGFEPQEQPSGEVVLRNCVFRELADSHRELICGMNAALVRGLLDGARLRSPHVAGGPPEPTCCVRLVG